MSKIQSKTARTLEGPSLFQIIFGALLSLFLGAALGAICLIVRPVELVREVPGESTGAAIYQTVYFVAGSASASKGTAWKSKYQAFTSGQPGEITATDDELNTFIATVAPPPVAPPPPAVKPAAAPDAKGKPAAVAPPPPKPTGPSVVIATLPTGTVNFRLDHDSLQTALPANLNALGADLSLLIQMRGGFAKGTNGFVFQPTEFYVGSLPLHRLPGMPGWILGRLLAAQKNLPADLMGAWQKLGNVTVENRVLKLSLP